MKSNRTEAEIARELVDKIINGDTRAESEMVSKYHRGLVVMLNNKAKDRFLAEDIAQQTWLLVIQKLRANELRDPSKLSSYIIQIAKNQLLMSYRGAANKTTSASDDLPEIADGGRSPEQQLVDKQLAKIVGKLLNEMSTDRDKHLLHRFYLVGDEKKNLCDEYGLKPEHFDRVMFRARTRFKQLWQQHSEAN